MIASKNGDFLTACSGAAIPRVVSREAILKNSSFHYIWIDRSIWRLHNRHTKYSHRYRNNQRSGLTDQMLELIQKPGVRSPRRKRTKGANADQKSDTGARAFARCFRLARRHSAWKTHFPTAFDTRASRRCAQRQNHSVIRKQNGQIGGDQFLISLERALTVNLRNY